MHCGTRNFFMYTHYLKLQFFMGLYLRAPNSIFFPLHNGIDKMFIAFVGFPTKENVCSIKMCNLCVIGKTNSLKIWSNKHSTVVKKDARKITSIRTSTNSWQKVFSDINFLTREKVNETFRYRDFSFTYLHSNVKFVCVDIKLQGLTLCKEIF